MSDQLEGATSRGCGTCGQYMTMPERKSGKNCVTCRRYSDAR